MSKIKIYELAKELKVTSREVIELLGKKNIEVKSHMSSIENTEADQGVFCKGSKAGRENISKARRKSGRKARRKSSEKVGREGSGKAGGEARGGSEEKEYRPCVPPPEYTEGCASGRKQAEGERAPYAGQAYAGK